MPGGVAEAFAFPPAASAPTAKRLSARAVRVDPHDGHFTFARCNCSNFSWHALQVYS